MRDRAEFNLLLKMGDYQYYLKVFPFDWQLRWNSSVGVLAAQAGPLVLVYYNNKVRGNFLKKAIENAYAEAKENSRQALPASAGETLAAAGESQATQTQAPRNRSIN